MAQQFDIDFAGRCPLEWPADAIDGKTYNVGFENFSVEELAAIVKKEVGADVSLVKVPTDDNRSYHISSAKIQRELGFQAQHTIQDAVKSLVRAFKEGKVPNAMTNNRYYNIKTLQEIQLK